MNIFAKQKMTVEQIVEHPMAQAVKDLGERVQQRTMEQIAVEEPVEMAEDVSFPASKFKKLQRKNKKSRRNDDDATLEAAMLMAAVGVDGSQCDNYDGAVTHSEVRYMHVYAVCTLSFLRDGGKKTATVMIAGLELGPRRRMNCERARASDSGGIVAEGTGKHGGYLRALVLPVSFTLIQHGDCSCFGVALNLW